MPSVVGNNTYSTEFAQQIAVDAGSGSFAGATCFIFEGLKKRFQRGELLRKDFFELHNGNLWRVLHPKEAFRGATSFSISVALNAAAGLTFSKFIRSRSFYDDSLESHKLITAIAGGMIGAVVASTPVENTIVVQQEHKIKPIQAWRYMLKQGLRRPWVGVRELMMREAGFIGSVLYFGPKVREIIIEKTNNQALAMLGSIGVGATFATLTHPADTLATWRQKKEGKLSLIGGIKELYALAGTGAFFRGVGARIWLFTGCFLILEKVPPYVNKKIDEITKGA
jgi:hypothetical protein